MTPPLSLEERVASLEAMLSGKLPLHKIPLKALQDRLTTSWDPSAGELLLPGSVTNSLLGTDSVDDRVLASPDADVYRLLLAGSANFGGASGIGTRCFQATGSTLAGGVNVASPINLIRLAAADFDVTGKASKLRVAAQLLTNATAPTGNFTFGLHEITAVAGGAGGLTYTIGAAIAASAVVFTAPAASTRHTDVSADFDLPADGFYALGVANSAITAANSFEMLTAQLHVRHVDA